MYYVRSGVGLGSYLVGILPHGIFELPALILSCALGLLICRTGTEKLRKRSDVSFLRRVLDCNRVFLSFVAPLLLVAALVSVPSRRSTPGSCPRTTSLMLNTSSWLNRM